MWGCLGKFTVFLTVLVVLGAIGTAALGTVAAVAIPNLLNSRVSTTVHGVDQVFEARLSSDPSIAVLQYQNSFDAFGMRPGEWIMLVALAMCAMLTVALMAGVLGMYRHNRRREPDDARETMMIQELHHLALRMDERIESLETLMLGHGRAKH